MYFGATIFRQLTMAQLQKLCRHNGLSALGRHTTLENRLKNAGVASAAAPNDQPVKDVHTHCYCASLVRTLYMTWRTFKRVHLVETQQNVELMTFAVT